MIEKILMYLFIGLAIFLAFRLLKKGASKSVKSIENGSFLLRMNKLYALIGILGFVLGLVLAVFMIFLAVSLGFIFLTLLIFWGTTIPCWVYYRNHTLHFDEEQFEVNSFWGKTANMTWDQIHDVNYNQFSGLLVVSDRVGKQIKIHQHLVGLTTFIEKIKEKKLGKN